MGTALEGYSAGFPDAAKDARLNLRNVLADSELDERTRWAVALASAHTLGDAALVEAVLEGAGAHADEAVREDAQAAAVLMAMNNVYYRFRHFTGKAEYQRLPARLRMTRMAAPKTSKMTFELLSLAVSALNGCETCVQSHETSLIALGETPERIHDAVRIAAVLASAHTARGLAPASVRASG